MSKPHWAEKDHSLNGFWKAVQDYQVARDQFLQALINCKRMDGFYE